jgi:CheY-like chemotaxis protein
VQSLLEPTGVNMDWALNGQEALRLFTASPGRYDMIFMDIQMPEMDGYEATRLIRASEADSGGHIPIIAMTASVFREDVEQCFAVGMDGHLGKPLDLNDILSILREYF